MENASKALIMAGAILLAIMIISLGVYLFYTMSGKAKSQAEMDEQIISAFNSKITPYVGNSISGSQVNALLQYCLSSNLAAKKNGETEKYITISGVATLDKDSTTFTRVNTSGTYYTVKATYADSGLITQIEITLNS